MAATTTQTIRLMDCLEPRLELGRACPKHGGATPR